MQPILPLVLAKPILLFAQLSRGKKLICMTALYQKHYPLMFVMAMRYVNQLSDAEDIVSNSCESLIKHIDTILHKQLWLTLYQREPFYLV